MDRGLAVAHHAFAPRAGEQRAEVVVDLRDGDAPRL
jgi:hypothetical protein